MYENNSFNYGLSAAILKRTLKRTESIRTRKVFGLIGEIYLVFFLKFLTKQEYCVDLFLIIFSEKNVWKDFNSSRQTIEILCQIFANKMYCGGDFSWSLRAPELTTPNILHWGIKRNLSASVYRGHLMK